MEGESLETVEELQAKMAELIAELAGERLKNEVLMTQILKAEDTLVAQDVENFKDVIPNDDRGFWQGQLLENRSAALGALTRMRSRTVAGAIPEVPKPLHNRELAARQVAVAGATDATKASSAVMIRNRAQEIARLAGCSYSAAFKQAEQELLQ